MTTVEKWGTLCILITICGIYLFVKEVSALCGFFVAIPYIFSSYKRKYIVKEWRPLGENNVWCSPEGNRSDQYPL